MRAIFITLVVLVTLSAGCNCRKKSDEVLLREKIDTSYVHLYVASKIALTEKSPDAAKARTALVKLMKVTTGAGVSELSTADASALALALWDMRGVGKEAVERGRKDYPDPVLPALVADPMGAMLGKALDANTEHGVLLLAFTLLKAHPKSPVPVPPEILLYEAWGHDPDTMTLPSMSAAMHGVKAYTYAGSDLCDLAAKEAAVVPDDGKIVDTEDLGKDLEKLTGQEITLDAGDTADVDAAIRTLSNGALALCYLKRDELDKATPPLKKCLDGADQLGVKGKEMDALRAYVSCGGGDKCKDKIDRPTLAILVGKVAYEQLEKSGLIDALADNAAINAIKRYVVVMADTLGSAKEAIPSFDNVKEKATSWWPF
jgi:hypothetical protein